MINPRGFSHCLAICLPINLITCSMVKLVNNPPAFLVDTTKFWATHSGLPPISHDTSLRYVLCPVAGAQRMAGWVVHNGYQMVGKL